MSRPTSSPLAPLRPPSIVVTALPLFVLAIASPIAAQLWMRAEVVGIDQFRLPKELAILMVASLAAMLSAVVGRRLRIDGIAAAFALSTAWMLLRVARSDNPWNGYRALQVGWTALLAYWVARHYAPSRGGRTALLASLCLGGLFAASATLVEYTGIWYGWSLHNRAPSGVFGNRNHSAHFVALALPAAFALLCRRVSPLRVASWREHGPLLLGAASTCLGAAAIVTSRTRAAWLALAGAMLVVSAIALAHGIRGAGGVRAADTSLGPGMTRWAVAALAGVMLALLLPTPLDWRTAHPMLESARNVANFRAGSGKGRVVQYATTLRMVADNPINGVGPGNWSLRYADYARPGDPSVEADGVAMSTDRLPLNDWLGMIAEGGVASAAVLLIIAIASVRSVARLLRAHRGRDDVARGTALAGALTIIGILGSLDAVLQSAAPALMAAVMVAALRGGERDAFAIEATRARRSALVAVILLPSCVFSFLIVRRLAAVRIYKEDVGIQPLRRAIATDPSDYLAFALLTRRYVLDGRCEEARSAAMAADRLLPGVPARVRLLGPCAP